MTEYDFSPEAYERHLATQQRIGRWVDETERHPKSNPFFPLPPTSHAPSDHFTRRQPPPPPPPPPAAPHPAYGYGYEHGYSQPQSAPHSAPPTRPSSSHRRHHGHSRSKGYRLYASANSSPHSNSTPLPLLHRNYHPDLVKSLPQPATAPVVYPPSNGYGVPSPYPPNSHPHPPQSAISYPTQYSGYQTPQSTYSSTTSTSAYTTLPGGGTYVQPSQKQAVVVPINGGAGGYVIVPPPGTYYRTADMYNIQQEEPEDRGQSFFGRLTGGASAMDLSMKKKRRKRSESY